MFGFLRFNWKINYCFIWQEFCRKRKYWLKFSHELTKKQKPHAWWETSDVGLPLTSPGPATQGGSCGCCRAQWEKDVRMYRLSRPGPSPLSRRASFYITRPVFAGRRYSCGCTPTTLLSTSWRQRRDSLICIALYSVETLQKEVIPCKQKSQVGRVVHILRKAHQHSTNTQTALHLHKAHRCSKKLIRLQRLQFRMNKMQMC